MNPIQQAIEALEDILNGWKYIRDFHGDLYGVGWDRAQDKAESALTSLRSLQKEVEGVLPTLPFAVFDEFGYSCEDRVRDHFRTAVAAAIGRGAGQADPLQKLADSMKPLDADIAEIIAREGSSLYAEGTQPTQAEAPSEREAGHG